MFVIELLLIQKPLSSIVNYEETLNELTIIKITNGY